MTSFKELFLVYNFSNMIQKIEPSFEFTPFYTYFDILAIYSLVTSIASYTCIEVSIHYLCNDAFKHFVFETKFLKVQLVKVRQLDSFL